VAGRADGAAGLPPASEMPDVFRHLSFVPDSDIECARDFELRFHPLPLFRHYTSETRRFSKSRSFCFLQLSSMRPTTIMSAKVTAHEPINSGFATP
jgi:hypothetical protein